MTKKSPLNAATILALATAITVSGFAPAHAASPIVPTASSTAISAAVSIPAAVKAAKGVKYSTLGASNLRAGTSTSTKVIAVVKANYTFTSTGVAKNGWIKLTYKGKTAYISNRIVKVYKATSKVQVSKSYKGPLNPVTKPNKSGKYTTNREGLPESARWYTKNTSTKLRTSVNGSIKASGFPSGTVAWQKSAKGTWVQVNAAGVTGWVKKSELVRKSTRPTSWNKKYSSSTIRKMSNGYLKSDALVAIGWDPGRNLIAGPALGNLNAMNAAFKKQFGHNLEIDLTYRPMTVQTYLYRLLGANQAARPGTSVHGKGFAIDFPESYNYGFSGPHYKWLKKNSHKFGWVHRSYLEQYRNGRKNPLAEAWHFEYVR